MNSDYTPARRVTQFCDWLDAIPSDPPFFNHPDFARFADLTDAEIMAAKIEMHRRAERALSEADALQADHLQRSGRVVVVVANDDEDL